MARAKPLPVLPNSLPAELTAFIGCEREITEIRTLAGSSRLVATTPRAIMATGVATWTRDPAQAMSFEAAEEATACYRAVPWNRPLRPDGKPNRPLTMFTVAFW